MIRLNNVTKIYNPGNDNEFIALKDINLTINDGELVAIIGKSGAGKSTLLHILACVDSYEEGEYCIDNLLVKNLSDKEMANIRNKKIGIVMQNFALIDDFTCIENVLIPLDFSGIKKKNKSDIALKMFNSVDMSELVNKPVNKLSGGQKQRIAIARAIVNDPDIILADEPTGALDTKTSAEIISLFHKLNEKGKTVIIVTHDMKIAEQCNRIIEISDGKIV